VRTCWSVPARAGGRRSCTLDVGYERACKLINLDQKRTSICSADVQSAQTWQSQGLWNASIAPSQVRAPTRSYRCCALVRLGVALARSLGASERIMWPYVAFQHERACHAAALKAERTPQSILQPRGVAPWGWRRTGEENLSRRSQLSGGPCCTERQTHHRYYGMQKRLPLLLLADTRARRLIQCRAD
jgi:hypothetical protein